MTKQTQFLITNRESMGYGWFPSGRGGRLSKTRSIAPPEYEEPST